MPLNRFWNLLSKKLSGEALPEELEELQSLFRQYPELIGAAEQMEGLWNQQYKHDPLDAELAFQEHLNVLQKAGIEFPELETPVKHGWIEEDSKGRRKKWLMIPLAAAVMIAGFVIWQQTRSSSEEVMVQSKNFIGEVSTQMGNRTSMVLPDSTVVWLNAGSKLTFNEKFGITNRNTTLTGEAFFDVKKSKIPFIIQANGVQIKVLGTVFNVKSYPNEKTETSLLKGQVEITIDKRPGEKFILKPNEKLVVANEQVSPVNPRVKKQEPIVVLGNITHANDHSIIETSWVENKLVFEDESFAELAVKMERWYGVTIDIRTEEVANERLSGTFTRESIHEALEILQMITPFQFTIKSKAVIITKKLN